MLTFLLLMQNQCQTTFEIMHHNFETLTQKEQIEKDLLRELLIMEFYNSELNFVAIYIH